MDEITIDNIHEEVKKLGVEISHHESDLYIPVTPETRALIARYKSRSNVTTFVEKTLPDTRPCVLCGHVSRKQTAIRAWYDIPFAYQPFWDKVEQATRQKVENGHYK
jgi:hypothetical protein